MSTVDYTTVKNCLLESILLEIKGIEEIDYSAVNVSDAFKERIKRTVADDSRSSKKNGAKRITLILVAAILVSLSVMFAVSAEIRQAVADFFVNVHDTFTEFFITKENELDYSTTSNGSETNDDSLNESPPSTSFPITIETKYIPTYINENSFTQLDQAISPVSVFTVWSNGTEIVDLSQNTIVNNDTVIDAEDAEHQVKYINGLKVYFMLKNNIYFVHWVQYGYSFGLSADESLGWHEVEKIILSIEPVAK